MYYVNTRKTEQYIVKKNGIYINHFLSIIPVPSSPLLLSQKKVESF